MNKKSGPKQKKVKLPVALVTGSAKGLGAHLAKELAKSGYIVIVHYFSSKTPAEKTLNSIRKTSPDSSMLQADVRSAEAVQTMIDLIIERYGRLDVLINNVGNFIYEPLTTTSIEKWNDVIESNLNATFYTCKATLKYMRKQRSGRIINFGQVDAGRMLVRPNTTPYFIAKAGIIMLTKQLAQENAKYGITVNAISPGMLESSVVKLPTPTGKAIMFTDISKTILFLLEPANQKINGANVEVADGFTF